MSFDKILNDVLLENQQLKEDARLYLVLKHIVKSNLTIPHNLIGIPDDEFNLTYQQRLEAAKEITAQFHRLTDIDLNY